MATLQATTFNTTDGLILSKGTSAQRPSSPAIGMLRHNTTFNCQEFYDGSNWIDMRTGFPITNIDGLMIRLDASIPASYPIGSSSGSPTWYDISGYDNHFDVRSNVRFAGPPSYMAFNGSYGVAKRDWNVRTSNAEITINDNNGGVTYVFATRILQTNTDWRTLTRSTTYNHHVMAQINGWNLGMYDNVSNNFISSGFSQQSLPGYASNAWNVLYVRFQNISPYWQLSYNDTPGTIRGSITDIRARHLYGIQCLGGWSDSNGNTIAPSYQHWGDIAFFHCYNRFLSDTELLNIFQEVRSRFNL